MWDWIGSTFDTLAQYFLDLFTWFFEIVFWCFDEFIRFLWELAKPSVYASFGELGQRMPQGLLDSVVVAYGWFEYANEWVPLGFGIKLVIAYFGFASFLYCFRVFLSFLPFSGRV